MDGFGIFGPRGVDGATVTNNDLDECHGHSHPIMWDGKEVDMFHDHVTSEYPYAIGCFRGTPVSSMAHGGAGGAAEAPAAAEMMGSSATAAAAWTSIAAGVSVAALLLP